MHTAIPLDGVRVVVTGVIAQHSRQTAEQQLREAGALVQSGVTGTTDLLVTGGKVGQSKLTKAQQLGVRVIAWENLWNPAAATVVAATPARVATPKVRQIGPMLAKGAELPTGPGWLYEVKWDGYRCVATVKDGKVALQSRSGKSDYTEQFAAIAAALSQLPDCILDGELVVLDSDGNTSFESMGTGSPDFLVFDVLEHPDYGDVRGWTLEQRRNLLEQFLEKDTSMVVSDFPVAHSPAFDDGPQLLAWAADQAIEGIVAKRLSSTYKEGSRNGDWIKVKIRNEQEFAVVGFIPGEGNRAGAAGSLLLAVYDEKVGRFEFVGRVGTGQQHAFWRSITELPQLGRKPTTAALDLARITGAAEIRDAVWLKPKLVVQVRFQRWTEDGRLWHPSVTGVRTDKQPKECTR